MLTLGGGGIPQNTYNVTGRVDYNLNDKTQMFFRYVDYHEEDQSGSAFNSPYTQYNIAFSNFSSAYLYSIAHQFSSSLSSSCLWISLYFLAQSVFHRMKGPE